MIFYGNLQAPEKHDPAHELGLRHYIIGEPVMQYDIVAENPDLVTWFMQHTQFACMINKMYAVRCFWSQEDKTLQQVKDMMPETFRLTNIRYHLSDTILDPDYIYDDVCIESRVVYRHGIVPFVDRRYVEEVYCIANFSIPRDKPEIIDAMRQLMSQVAHKSMLYGHTKTRKTFKMTAYLWMKTEVKTCRDLVHHRYNDIHFRLSKTDMIGPFRSMSLHHECVLGPWDV